MSTDLELDNGIHYMWRPLFFFEPQHYQFFFLVKIGSKMECASLHSVIHFVTLDECAQSCAGVSSLFAYGIQTNCFTKGCRCLCEIGAQANGTCSTRQDDYDLYRYNVT